VGEVRDKETAQLAVQASLTGHLVLATLHTNDAPSAIARLMDIGIEPYLVTSTLLAVLAQRLVRRSCKVCAGTGLADGNRCEKCFGSGYFGRVAIYEIMPMTDQIRRLTAQHADSVTIADTARSGGMKTLRDDCREKIGMGLTTEVEMNRVLG
jgi:general secretion pathway protein E